MSLLFPHDELSRREKVVRLSRLSETEMAWLVSKALDDASGPWADASDEVLADAFRYLVRSSPTLSGYSHIFT